MRGDGTRAGPSRAQWLRRLASRRRDKTAFVFSGGGPLGALQVGALRALFEKSIVPDLAVGTSVGAMNATFMAFDPTPGGVAKLEDVWLGQQEGDLFPGGRFKASWARMLVRGDRVFESSGIKRLIETRLGNAHFEDAQIPLGVVATELETGAERVFTQGEVLSPLLASSAMPGVFAPVEIDGTRYIDGGVSNNVPITPAIRMGATTIYVMDSTSHAYQRRPLARPMDYLLHAFSLARSQRLVFEQDFYAQHVRLVLLPATPLDFFVPFASVAHTPRLIEPAYETTRRFLAGETGAEVEELADGAVEAIHPAK